MIVQGSNIPILLKITDEDFNIENLEFFNAGLFDKTQGNLKQWELQDVQISENMLILPLLQSDTCYFETDKVYFECKIKDKHKNIIFISDNPEIEIVKKYNQTIIGDDKPNFSIENGLEIEVKLLPFEQVEPIPPIPETPYAKMSFGILKGNTDDIVFLNQDKIELEVIDNKNSSFEVSVKALEALNTFDSTTPSQVGDVPYSWFGLVLGDFITVEDVSKDIVGLTYNGNYTLAEADATEANAVLPEEFIDKQNKFFALWLANDKPESMTENKRTISISDGIDVVTINITFIPFV